MILKAKVPFACMDADEVLWDNRPLLAVLKEQNLLGILPCKKVTALFWSHFTTNSEILKVH